MSWKDDYPRLYELFAASNTSHADNYFAGMDGLQSPQAIELYRDWENRLNRLDPDSRKDIIQRAAPLVTRKDERRGWSELFDMLYEVKGYNYLQDLGYTDVRFVPRASGRTPDTHGSASFGDALLEMKTVNISDEDIAQLGTVQEAFLGVPEGLKRKLASDYKAACEQLHSIQVRDPTRRIVYFHISVDLQVALSRANVTAIDEFLRSIEGDCEIFHHSQYWSP
jgi:hypothetical protein